MKLLKEILLFLLGFAPWILFLFFSGNSLASLERAIIICLVASVIFGFRDLRRGLILPWASLLFFVSCAIMVNLLKMVAVAQNMGIIANGFLAAIIWVTILIGKPFTLQYAKAELPKEHWNDPELVRSCRFIAIVWGVLLTFSASLSLFKIYNPSLYPGWVYSSISIGTMLGGTIFTQVYKKSRRSEGHEVQTISGRVS